MRLRHLFRQKPTDDKVNAILNDITRTATETSKSAKKLERLLKNNGVSLQITIATGGGHRK